MNFAILSKEALMTRAPVANGVLSPLKIRQVDPVDYAQDPKGKRYDH